MIQVVEVLVEVKLDHSVEEQAEQLTVWQEIEGVADTLGF